MQHMLLMGLLIAFARGPNATARVIAVLTSRTKERPMRVWISVPCRWSPGSASTATAQSVISEWLNRAEGKGGMGGGEGEGEAI